MNANPERSGILCCSLALAISRLEAPHTNLQQIWMQKLLSWHLHILTIIIILNSDRRWIHLDHLSSPGPPSIRNPLRCLQRARKGCACGRQRMMRPNVNKKTVYPYNLSSDKRSYGGKMKLVHHWGSTLAGGVYHCGGEGCEGGRRHYFAQTNYEKWI